MSTALSEALDLASRGFHVLQLAPHSKIPPRGSRGLDDATRDPAVIEERFRREPRSNLGLRTGDVGGLNLVVVDIDVPTARDHFLARFGPIQPTVVSKTPRGWHVFFRAAAGVVVRNSAGRLLKHVDIRADRGYVVGPGSVVGGIEYRWQRGCSPADVALAPLPADIIGALDIPRLRRDVLRQGAKRDLMARVAAYVAALPRGLVDGQGRNATAFRLACFIAFDCGGTRHDVLVGLRVWNARNREPLEETRLTGIATNAMQYGGRPARGGLFIESGGDDAT